MGIPIFQVNAFTGGQFQGNPAAVVLLENAQETGWMQRVAKEAGLSETAFAYPHAGGYHLQWFTPKTEVELCGHATLATAHVLWETGTVWYEKIRFSTLSGWLTAQKTKRFVELDFPKTEVTRGDLSEEIIRAIGAVPDFIGFGGEKWILEYHDVADIKRLSPDFDELNTFEGRGLIVTSQTSQPGVDFVSRYFAPWIGVNEDPVTGSAHCILGPYWGKKLGKSHMTAHQISTRGGVVQVRLSGERVYLGGQAVIVSQSEIDP